MGLQRSHLVAIAVAIATPRPAGAQMFNRADDMRITPPELRLRPAVFVLDAQAGTAYDRGNVDHLGAHGTLGFGVRLSPRNELFADAASDHEVFDGMAKLDKDKGAVLYVYKLAEHWNLYAESTHARNRFLLLRYRTYDSGGICLHSFAGPAFSVILISFDVGPEADWWDDASHEVALRGAGRFNFVLPITATASVGSDFVYMPTLSAATNFRVFSQGFLEVKITPQVFALRVSLTDEYDSRPRPGVRTNDISLIPALVAHWKT